MSVDPLLLITAVLLFYCPSKHSHFKVALKNSMFIFMKVQFPASVTASATSVGASTIQLVVFESLNLPHNIIVQ